MWGFLQVCTVSDEVCAAESIITPVSSYMKVNVSVPTTPEPALVAGASAERLQWCHSTDWVSSQRLM